MPIPWEPALCPAAADDANTAPCKSSSSAKCCINILRIILWYSLSASNARWCLVAEGCGGNQSDRSAQTWGRKSRSHTHTKISTGQIVTRKWSQRPELCSLVVFRCVYEGYLKVRNDATVAFKWQASACCSPRANLSQRNRRCGSSRNERSKSFYGHPGYICAVRSAENLAADKVSTARAGSLTDAALAGKASQCR